MKKLLLGLTVLLSISASAKDYKSFSQISKMIEKQDLCSINLLPFSFTTSPRKKIKKLIKNTSDLVSINRDEVLEQILSTFEYECIMTKELSTSIKNLQENIYDGISFDSQGIHEAHQFYLLRSDGTGAHIRVTFSGE